jgi:hypothetical protein
MILSDTIVWVTVRSIMSHSERPSWYSVLRYLAGLNSEIRSLGLIDSKIKSHDRRFVFKDSTTQDLRIYSDVFNNL